MTTSTPIEHITVLGAGTMGSQIAAVCALSGYRTTLVDIAEAPLEQATAQLDAEDMDGVDTLRQAAELGFAPAQLHLAGLYQEGGKGLTLSGLHGGGRGGVSTASAWRGARSIAGWSRRS